MKYYYDNTQRRTKDCNHDLTAVLALDCANGELADHELAVQNIWVPKVDAVNLISISTGVEPLMVPFGAYAQQAYEFGIDVLLQLGTIEPSFIDHDVMGNGGTGVYGTGFSWRSYEYLSKKRLKACVKVIKSTVRRYPLMLTSTNPNLIIHDAEYDQSSELLLPFTYAAQKPCSRIDHEFTRFKTWCDWDVCAYD